MRFTVYSKEGCPFCDQIKLLFDLNEFNYVEYKLDRDFNREGFYNQFGEGSTFPQVVMNDQVNLGGCANTLKYLQEQDICCNV